MARRPDKSRSLGSNVTETSSRFQEPSAPRRPKKTRGPRVGPSPPAKFARSAVFFNASGSIRSEVYGFFRRITIAATTATIATMMTTPPMSKVVSIPPEVPPPPPPVDWTTSDPCWAAYPWTPQKQLNVPAVEAVNVKFVAAAALENLQQA